MTERGSFTRISMAHDQRCSFPLPESRWRFPARLIVTKQRTNVNKPCTRWRRVVLCCMIGSDYSDPFCSRFVRIRRTVCDEQTKPMPLSGLHQVPQKVL